MNILVVTGSPRVNGNSDMLANRFIKGATEAGHDTRRIDAGRANISGCRACEYCFSHEGACAIQDDMQNFYPHLYWADAVVYAFPMYCFSYPAQIKAFIDRMFCAAVKPLPITKTALLLCFEDPDERTADSLLQGFRLSSRFCNQEIVGEVVVKGVGEKGSIKDNDGLEKAYELGRSFK